MAKPWQTLDKAETPDGVLELRRRGERDFLILINNRVLMNSSANRSELALGELACKVVAAQPRSARAYRRPGHGAHPAGGARFACLMQRRSLSPN